MTEMMSIHILVGAIGSAILHSLWLGVLIGGVTAGVLWVLRTSDANVRYAVACIGLAAITVGWLVTAVAHLESVGDAVAFTSLPQGEAPLPSAIDDPPISPLADASIGSGRTTAMERLRAWSTAAVPLWFAGVLLLSIRLALGWVNVRRLHLACERIGEPPATTVHTMARRLGINRSVRLMQSAAVRVPMLVGWIRPVILVPTSVLSGLTVAQLEAVIAHELAHVRRHDYLANIAQSVAEIVLFYHPACWWISRQIRIEREHCCDDIAAAACGDSVLYAEALADLETLRSATPFLGVAATDGVLLRRIRRLVDVAQPKRRLPSAWAALAVPATVLVLAFLGSPTPAQEIQSERGVVQGRVVDSRSGRPIAGATVTLAGSARSATASTDDAGRYVVTGLEAGDYEVEARAGGYLSMAYGGREPNERGVPLAVQSGRVTAGIDLRLEATGVITGRVFDDRGEGLAGVEIELLADRLMPDGTRLVGVGFAQSESNGVFTVDEVPPGDYYVRAYVPSSIRPSRTDERQVYRATFFPGVTGSEYAQRLALSSGQELFGIDFSLATASPRTVGGVIEDPSRAELSPSMRVHMRAVGIGSIDAEYNATIDGQGRFAFSDVVPGEYLISVMEPGLITSRWVSASRSVIVEDDVTDLRLRARLGARVYGRVVRDATASRAFDPAGVNVVFEHRMTSGAAGIAWTGVTALGGNGARRIGSDGTFTIESPGGPFRIRVSEVPRNWTLKAIRLDGVDVTDQEIDIAEGTRRVDIELTDRVSTVRGQVLNKDGVPVPHGSVIVFADDASRWDQSSRFVQEARPDRTGQFQLRGLPPADYLAVAMPDIPVNAWRNPEVLGRLRPLATRFPLAEGDERVITLRPTEAKVN